MKGPWVWLSKFDLVEIKRIVPNDIVSIYLVSTMLSISAPEKQNPVFLTKPLRKSLNLQESTLIILDQVFLFQ